MKRRTDLFSTGVLRFVGLKLGQECTDTKLELGSVHNLLLFEQVHWGSYQPVAGVGGAMTLRGVKFGRWRDKGKAVSSAEARVHVWQHSLLDHQVDWSLAPFTDVIAVFDLQELDGVPVPHAGAGIGLRVVLDEMVTARVDAGVGTDPIEEEDGSVTQEASFGMYVVLGNSF